MSQTINILHNGQFGNKEISISFRKAKSTKNVVIFFHGAYSSGLQTRYKFLASQLAKKNIATSFIFESSRSLSYSQYIKSDILFEDYSRTFKGKTFIDELEDAQSYMAYVKDYIRNHYDGSVNLHLVGSSLGGIILSYFIAQEKNIKSITLLGSGTTVEDTNRPILSALPSQKEIIRNFKKFDGVLSCVHGEKDTVILLKSARKIFDNTLSASLKQFIVLKGVDHRFYTKNNIEQEMNLTKLLFEIIKETILLSSKHLTNNN